MRRHAPKSLAPISLVPIWLAACAIALVLLAGSQSAHAEGKAVPLTYDKCSPAERTQVTEAMASAEAALSSVIRDLGSAHPSKIALFELDRWFGHGADIGQVLRIYRNLHKRLRHDADPIESVCDRTEPLYGWTMMEVDGDAWIGFGRSFFETVLVGGFDTRMGTVIHEVSHLERGIGSDDIAYGVEDALNLARDNPVLALRNADNIEYFIESLMEM